MRYGTILILTVFNLASCDSDSEDNKFAGKRNVSAQIVDERDPALDGCGWIVHAGSKRYMPVNLPDDFKIDELLVTISFTEVGTLHNCGFGPEPQPITKIYLLEIEED